MSALPSSHVLAPLFELAGRNPDRQLLALVDERGRDSEVRTAGQLARTAARLGAYLREGCGLAPGDVALLIYPPSIEFIEALTACLYAGIIPAPVYPPSPNHPGPALTALSAIAQQAGARAILTSRAYRWASRLGAARAAFGSEQASWPALPWHVTQGLGWFSPRQDAAYPAALGDLALLQFTSGSTSTPKGVRLTHGNLIHQLIYNAEALRMGDDARLVAWVPQYHDLGLISGLMSVLRGNGSLWFMSPQTFLLNAALWPETMHRVRATHTASPNFGFELLTRRTSPEQRARWDLSSLRVVMSAAEPIAPRTVDRFLEAFAPSGLRPESFCPAYGLAEHTVGVTLGGRSRLRVDRGALTSRGIALAHESGDLELVGCGRPSHGVEVRIVDPARRVELAEQQVGEIWVQSPSVADGYERDAEATEATFGATLEGEPGRWMRTGDLGFVHRGELYVTGREKDLIIIRGRNWHPEDLEEAVRGCHPDVRPGAIVAFSVPGEATEALVLVAELKDPKTADVEGALRAVEARVRETWPITATVALAPPGTVRKTTSGKLQRHACRQAWLEGRLALWRVSAPPPTVLAPGAVTGEPLRPQLERLPASERLGWLIDVLRSWAAVELLIAPTSIGPDDHLVGLGLDSLSSARLLTSVEEQAGHRLPATLLVENPTLRGAAGFVLRELGLEFLGGPEPSAGLEPLPFRPPHRAMAPASTRVAIIGGGVGGLVSALELARLGYRDIDLFEASEVCGGKVVSENQEGAVFELGQVAICDTYRVVGELVREMGLEFQNDQKSLFHWYPEQGFERAPALQPGIKWIRSVLKAARAEIDSPLPFPSMVDLDETFGQFLRRHNLRSIHPRFLFLWNCMGYGLDLEAPAAYVISYLQVVGPSLTTGHLVGGNQGLWITLAEHLEKVWGVRIHRRATVRRVTGDDAGVRVEVGGRVERFDEVIAAVPPGALASLLPPDDPRQPVLARHETIHYMARSFRARGLPPSPLFAISLADQRGRTFAMQPTAGQSGWYVGFQIGAAPGDRPFEQEAMQRELASTVKDMGGEMLATGTERTWPYFPHITSGPVAALRQAEGLQGARHIWATGSWLAFETVEHVARHARHLVQSCFDPSPPWVEPG